MMCCSAGVPGYPDPLDTLTAMGDEVLGYEEEAEQTAGGPHSAAAAPNPKQAPSKLRFNRP